MRARILFSVVFPVFLAQSIYAADFTIDTTADFDAGTKSTSNGNREIITESDVVSGCVQTPAPGTIELENIFSDKFDVADADAVTWKWSNTVFSGDASADIDTTTNDKLYMRAGSISGLGTAYVKTTKFLTGDFSTKVKLDFSSPGTATTYIKFSIDFQDSAGGANNVCIEQEYGLSYKRFNARATINGVTQTKASFNNTDTSVQFRIRRVGNAVSLEYDTAQSDSFTTLMTWTDAYLNSDTTLLPYFYITRVTNPALTTGEFSDYVITSGTVASGQTPYRTSGNWTSATQTMPTGERMVQTTLYHSGLDATNYIDKVEWLVGGVTNAVYDPVPGITNGASTCITRGMVTSGSFSAVNDDFQIKPYLVGDGLSTPTVAKIEGETMSSPRTVIRLR